MGSVRWTTQHFVRLCAIYQADPRCSRPPLQPRAASDPTLHLAFSPTDLRGSFSLPGQREQECSEGKVCLQKYKTKWKEAKHQPHVQALGFRATVLKTSKRIQKGLMGSFNRRVGYFLRKLEFPSSSLLIKAEASPLAFQPSHSRRLGTGIDLKDEGRITPPHSVDAPHFFQKVDSRKCTSPDVRLNTCFKKKIQMRLLPI